MNEEKLLKVLNGMLKYLEPIKFEDLNMTLPAHDQDGLRRFEEKYNKVGLKVIDSNTGSSVVALIATITDVLVDKRLAFYVNEITGNVIRFEWYEEN